ncbi:hypothetical protein [Sphingomonas sp.]|jgi:hypothetical protein|uniref:hypothetical protein n=1 Tax=Sphingomonas sp. TaxID=28214 RepID=UPI002D7EAA3E|nr:hypothetical protein [Sphingomonas sp.]HEU0043835.1 hypothetical protein [Sphingomonas sp.]
MSSTIVRLKPVQSDGPSAPHLAYLGLELPMELRDPVLRHHRNLSQLIENLCSAGLGTAKIQEHVDQLVESYRAELSATLTILSGEKADV